VRCGALVLEPGGRPGPGRLSFGALAGQASLARMLRKPLRTRAGVSRPGWTVRLPKTSSVHVRRQHQIDQRPDRSIGSRHRSRKPRKRPAATGDALRPDERWVPRPIRHSPFVSKYTSQFPP
jgi:hypothetical protein